MDHRRITSVYADSVIEEVYNFPLKTRAKAVRVMWSVFNYARVSGLKIRVSQKSLCTVKNRGVVLRILAEDEIDKLMK